MHLLLLQPTCVNKAHYSHRRLQGKALSAGWQGRHGR